MKKALIPFAALVVVINLVVMMVLGGAIEGIVNIAGAIWNGFMFVTWFRNQLIANGYHVEESDHVASNTEHHDFE